MNKIMATIKSYTSMEQSEVLVKILPIESADMRYGYIAPYEYSDRMYDGGFNEIPYPKDFLIKNPNFSANEYDAELPCWSLTALLSVIPKPDLIQNSEGTWLVRSWVNAYPWSVGGYSNPVDACYELILKLHEQNLL